MDFEVNIFLIYISLPALRALYPLFSTGDTSSVVKHRAETRML